MCATFNNSKNINNIIYYNIRRLNLCNSYVFFYYILQVCLCKTSYTPRLTDNTVRVVVILCMRCLLLQVLSHFSTIGPNGSKKGQVRFQLYFHVSLVRRGHAYKPFSAHNSQDGPHCNQGARLGLDPTPKPTHPHP